MIKWINPKIELPSDNTFVACMTYHSKECWPLSAEIIFGEVESYINENGERIARVNTCDYTGKGSYCWNFLYEYYNSNYICAWAYASDFNKPEFLNDNYV